MDIFNAVTSRVVAIGSFLGDIFDSKTSAANSQCPCDDASGTYREKVATLWPDARAAHKDFQ